MAATRKSSPSDTPDLRGSIRRHYDSLALLYRTFWGEHIHHGLWLKPEDTPRQAQAQLVAHLANRARVGPAERVLDVGCGYGGSGRWLSSHLNCHVTGLTISPKQARLNRRRSRKRGLGSRTAVVLADAAVPPFAAAVFDVVWVIECIEHLSEKPRFFGEAARMLRPGGRLALCSWQAGSSPRIDRGLLAEVCHAFLCPSLATADDYEIYCQDAGLELEQREDLTERVRPTWEIVQRRVQRNWAQPLRYLVADPTRRFVDGFTAIARAFDNGTMTYGLLVASKPYGSPLRRPR